MTALSLELTGAGEAPVFFQTVVKDCELACCLRQLHQKIMEDAGTFERSEALLTAFFRLLEGYSLPAAQMESQDSREEVEAVCAYLQEHYAQRITLEQLLSLTGLSRSTLFRVFTRVKGVTPYRYLESIRVHQAQKLLEQGIAPVEAALATGFSDQSHFTNFFHQLTGLTPGAYRNLRSKRK